MRRLNGIATHEMDKQDLINSRLVPTGDQVRAMRIRSGLKLRECADLFGYSLRGWQRKEEAGVNNRALSIGEWNFLLLLAGQHEHFILVERNVIEPEISSEGE